MLERITGVKKISLEQFQDRKWRQGVESLSAYMYDLQVLASELKLPEEFIKVSFLAGIPQKFAFYLKIGTIEKDNCVELAERAEKIAANLIEEAIVRQCRKA